MPGYLKTRLITQYNCIKDKDPSTCIYRELVTTLIKDKEIWKAGSAESLVKDFPIVLACSGTYFVSP